MQLFGQTYSLATADAVPVAVFFDGNFLGLSYIDENAADPTLRPFVALVPDFMNLADAYLGYNLSTDPGAGLGGFGNYTVAVVPEPAAVLLMLAGLGVVGGIARRARCGGARTDR